MDEVSLPASAIATSGSPPIAPAYQSDAKPSASARLACSIIRSTFAPPPLSPIRMVGTLPKRSVPLSGEDGGVIFHIARRHAWEEAVEAGAYRHSTVDRTLDEEGFIHA